MNIYGRGLLIRGVHKLTEDDYDLNKALLESDTALTYESDKDKQVARIYLQDKLLETIPLGYYYRIVQRYNSVFTLNPEPIVDVYDPEHFRQVSDNMQSCINRHHNYHSMKYDGTNIDDIKNSFGVELDESKIKAGDVIVRPVGTDKAFVINKELYEAMLRELK